jgi:hypothetical protein
MADSCEHNIETSGSIKNVENFFTLAERLLDSQQELCSLNLVPSKCFLFQKDERSIETSVGCVNPLKPNGNYMYHPLQQSVTLYFVVVVFHHEIRPMWPVYVFCIYVFRMILSVNSDYFLKQR